MAAPYPSEEQLRAYLGGGKAYKDRDEMKKIYKSLRQHVDKEVPDDLIKKRRPSESDEDHNYRTETYQPITDIPPVRVMGAYSKILRSKDWNLSFPQYKNAKIIPEESIGTFCLKNFPLYDSIEQWLIKIASKTMEVDPNSYIVTIPETFEIDDIANFLRPYPIVVHCDMMIYTPEKNDFFIFESTDKVDQQGDNNLWSYNTGRVFYVINADFIDRYEQINFSADYQRIRNINYTRKLPIYKVPGVFKSQKDRVTIQISRLDSMISELNLMAMESTDSQIVHTKTAFPLPWFWRNNACPTCEGRTVITNPSPLNTDLNPLPPITCTSCKGTGRNINSPMYEIEVQLPAAGEPLPPMPPGGIIERDVASAEFLDKSIEKHRYNAYAAVNMQFMDQVPLSISGDAKMVDKDENQNFVYSVAEDFIWILQKQIYWSVEWRYYKTVPSEIERKKMIPNIPVPMDFDMLPPSYLIQQLATAKAGNVSSTLIGALEKSIAAKLFYNMPEVAQSLTAIYDLNPLPGLDDNEKATRLMNKGITLQDYVISCNIESFVKQALESDPLFLDKRWEEKKKQMSEYAQEIIDQNDKVSADAIKKAMAINTDPGNDPAGPPQIGQQQEKDKAA